MKIFANLLTLLVAIMHVGIMVLEMFFWNHPVGQRIFAMTPEVAKASEVLAMNQGLYNGFLAAGLFWGLLRNRTDIKAFFLGCVVVAGIFGGITAKTSILFTQGLPALIALVLVISSSKQNNHK
jgi:putative membrane protein